MATKQKTDSSAPSGPEASTKMYPVEVSKVDPVLWLVKVPEVVAELVNAPTSSETTLARFTPLNGAGAASSSSSSSSSSGAGATAGRKRQRTQLKVELDVAAVKAAVGDDGAKRTPLKFNLTLEEPAGTRIMTHSSTAGSFSMLGVAAHSGTMAPDMSDPSYQAYVAWRRGKDKQKQANRAHTSVAESESIAASMQRSKEEAIAIAASSGQATRLNAASTIGAVPKVGSVLELFEIGAYWSIKQICEGTGTKEGDVRPLVIQYCDYLRSGDHSRSYILKKQYRTHKTPMPDAADEKNSVAAS